MLADSFGVAHASAETFRALDIMHPALGEVNSNDLSQLYGEPKQVIRDEAPNTIHVEKVRECIAAAPSLASPHMDGWRMEHLEALSRDDAFAAALASFISNIASADVPTATANYLASATLVALLKKNEEDIQAMRALLGPDFVLPYSPPPYGMCFREGGVKHHIFGNQG